MENLSIKVSIVILNYNDSETTISFLKSIKSYDIIDHIIVVDNCSTDDSYEKLVNCINNKIDVIKTERNGGYGYGNNYGVKYAFDKYGSKYIAISNPDVIISEETILKTVEVFTEYKDAGIVAPMMSDINGVINYRCVWKTPTFWQYLFFSFKSLHILTESMFYDPTELRTGIVRVGCVAGSFLIVDLNAFTSAGTYDENIFLYCEETSIGLRMSKTNYKSYVVTDQNFIHIHSVSIKKNISSKVKRAKLMWDSREYILTHYWNINFVKKAVIKLLKHISLVELYIYYLGK